MAGMEQVLQKEERRVLDLIVKMQSALVIPPLPRIAREIELSEVARITTRYSLRKNKFQFLQR